MGGKAEGGERVGFQIAGEVYFKVVDRFCDVLGEEFASNMFAAGSLRRKCNEMGDVDVVIVIATVEQEGQVNMTLRSMFGNLKNGKPKKSGLVEIDGHKVQVDVLVTIAEGLGAALMHSTGPFQLNIEQRYKAKSLGYKLNEKGLWQGEKRSPAYTEEEIYKVLGLAYLTPEQREAKIAWKR